MGKKFRITLCTVVFAGLWQALPAQVPYNITGRWNGGEGRKVLLALCNDGELESATVDSTVVKADGTFSLRGTVARQGCGCLSVREPKHASSMLFFDGSDVELLLTDTVETLLKRERPTVKFSIVRGDKNQQGAVDLLAFSVASFTNEFGEAMLKARVETVTDQQTIDSLNAEIRAKQAATAALITQYRDKYADCAIAPYFMETNMLKPCTTDELEDFFNHLTEEVRLSPKGRFIAQHIEAQKKLSAGALAPDFTLPTADGGSLALKDLRGRVVLIDFWASWCGPCMGEMPNVKALYEKYHTAGLEVLGISMDNKRDAWLRSIEKESLPWLQVSSLKGMGKCPVGTLYEVAAIPKFYIIDRDGRIVAKDLRGEELAGAVSSLFEK